MDRFELPPLATPAAQPPRRRGMWTALILFGVLFVFVALCGVGLVLVRALIAPQTVPVAGGGAESRDEKYKRVAAAFNSDEIGVRRGELRSIQELFDVLVEASQKSDIARWAGRVDVDRLIEQMQRTGGLASTSTWQMPMVRRFVRESLNVPADAQNVTIAHVDLAPGGRQGEVFATLHDRGAEMKIRMWIVKVDRQWKAYDWDLLDYGLRASREHTLYYVYSQRRDMEEYYALMDDLDAARTADENNKPQLVRQALERAERRRVPAEFQDDASLQIAFTWQSLGYEREGLAAFRRIADPDGTPGAYSGMAQTYRRRGQFKLALEAAQRNEALLGRGNEINGLQADILLQLDRIEEALPELDQALRAMPGQQGRLLTLGRLLPESRMQELVAHIRRSDNPHITADELAESFAYGGHAAAMRAALEVLELSPH